MLSIEELLTTTRTVRRRLRFGEPVDRSTVEWCLGLARFAPNGANRQRWRFVVVDDRALVAAIGEHYRSASRRYLADLPDTADARSARVLADRFDEIPLLVLGCVAGRLAPDAGPAAASGLYGSLYPALWSFMLAARERGLGTALTTVHLAREREIGRLLGIPADVTQVAMVAVGHLAGPPPGAAPRRPLAEVLAYNGW